MHPGYSDLLGGLCFPGSTLKCVIWIAQWTVGGGWGLPEIQRQRVYLGSRFSVKGGHSGPEALGSSIRHTPPQAQVACAARKPWLFLVPGAHPSCQGGSSNSSPAYFIPITGRLWGARKGTHSLLSLGSEEGCGRAKGPPCQCQEPPRPEWESSGAKLREETASPRGLALALERSPGAQGLGRKRISDKLSTPTAFNMPTHSLKGCAL